MSLTRLEMSLTAFLDHRFFLCQMTTPHPPFKFVKYQKKVGKVWIDPPPLKGWGGGGMGKKQHFLKGIKMTWNVLSDHWFNFCQMTPPPLAPRPPFPLFSQIPKKVFFNDEVLLKDILSLTLTLGWKNKKRPSGPIELDLEAGNLVYPCYSL